MYATGEIVLIIIGILIALNVNNWNEGKKTHETEIALLSEMKTNLSADLLDVQWNIGYNKLGLRSNEIVLKSLLNQDFTDDSLDYFYANISLASMFDKNLSSYKNLESIGFNLVKNDSLRIRITELYSYSYTFLTKMENIFYSIQSDKIIPLVLKNIDTKQVDVSGKPYDPLLLSKNHEFKESIKYNIHWYRFMIDLYETTAHEIKTLIDQINKEIDEYNS
jgi:hypothetical protein